MALLIASAATVIWVVDNSENIKHEKLPWFRRNQITLVLSSISFFFPMFFEALGLIEYYHPRQTLRIQLARIMVLNLLNLYSLIWALFKNIINMSDESKSLKSILQINLSETTAMTTSSPTVLNEVMDITLSSGVSTVAAITTISTTISLMAGMLNKSSSTLPTTMGSTTTTDSTFTKFDDKITTMLEKDLNTEQTTNPFGQKRTENSIFTTLHMTTTSLDTDTKNKSSRRKRDESYSDSTFTYEIYDEINSDIISDNSTEDILNLTMTTETENEIFTTVMTTTDDLKTETTLIDKPTTDSEYYFDDAYVSPHKPDTTTKVPLTTIGALTTNFPIQDVYTTTLMTTTQQAIRYNKTAIEDAEKRIRALCWETMFGQELVKLTVMDLVSCKTKFIQN